MFESNWGNPNVDSIEVDRNPSKGPNKGNEKVSETTVKTPVIAVKPKRNFT